MLVNYEKASLNTHNKQQRFTIATQRRQWCGEVRWKGKYYLYHLAHERNKEKHNNNFSLPEFRPPSFTRNAGNSLRAKQTKHTQ